VATRPANRALLGRLLGAETVVLQAAQHDAQLAATSHVPQIVASLLGDFLARHAPPGSTFGPGAADTTRLAASEPALWTEILLMIAMRSFQRCVPWESLAPWSARGGR